MTVYIHRLLLRVLKEVSVETGTKGSKLIFDGVPNEPVAKGEAVELRKKPRVAAIGRCDVLW